MVNIISGEVATNILKSDRGRALPAGSLYAPLSESFAGHVNRTPSKSIQHPHDPTAQHVRIGADGRLKDTTTPEQYAAAVVGEVTRRNPRAWFWTGATTSIVRYGDMFLWRTYWDGLFTKWFGLNVLKSGRV